MSTEANSNGNGFGRRVSIRRTKSYAESARVITPENITENGEPVINQIQRHKTFDTMKSLEKNQRDPTVKPLKKSSIVKEVIEEVEEETKNDTIEDVSTSIDSTEALPTEDEVVPIKDTIHEDDKDVDPVHLSTQDKTDGPNLVIDTSKYYPEEPNEVPSITTDVTNVIPYPPSSIPDDTSEDLITEISEESINEIAVEPLSPKIFLPNAKDDEENVPLVHGSYKVENENLQQKSGWSLWWSSFGKEDKKEVETSKKNKASSISSPKSPFSFFKTKSSTSLYDKNINYRQGKGTLKAYLITSPLIFKPLTREAEDTIYSLSHTKLATTYRPMVQQVYINNIMQQYIRKYKDAAYKIPFKTVRPPKKRRSLPKQALNNTITYPPPPVQKNQQRPVSTPGLSNYNFNEPIGVRTDSKKKKNGKKNTKRKQKLVNLDESKLDKILERGVEYEDINTKKPKRRTKVRPLSDDFTKKNVKSVYKNINHSISMEQLGSSSSSYSSSPINYSKYPSGTESFDYYNYFYTPNPISDNSSDDDDDDDDEIPLAMLRNRRSSIITV